MNLRFTLKVGLNLKNLFFEAIWSKTQQKKLQSD